MTVDASSDGLDDYDAAYYRSGNDLYFELRHYASHPDYTTTLYLSFELPEGQIVETIERVVDLLHLPWSAVIWFWSEDLASIRLISPENMRLREAEARDLVLKAASRSPNHTITMEGIRQGIISDYPLSVADQVRSDTRPAEQLWQQILRNVVSHRGGQRSIFARNLAIKVGNGIKITKDGLAYLKRSGFSV